MRHQRWEQRFENFERAFLLLKEGLNHSDTLSDLEKEGIIQRFEYTFELAWKTLKDYLTFSGVKLTQITPREVIKQAFAAQLIENGQTWMDMLNQRDLMAHTYNKENFQKAFQLVSGEYLEAIQQAFSFLKGHMSHG